MGSETEASSDLALLVAARLAARLRVELHVVHGLRLIGRPLREALRILPDLEASKRRILDDLRARLEALGLGDVACRFRLENHDLLESTLRYAGSVGPALTVLPWTSFPAGAGAARLDHLLRVVDRLPPGGLAFAGCAAASTGGEREGSGPHRRPQIVPVPTDPPARRRILHRVLFDVGDAVGPGLLVLLPDTVQRAGSSIPRRRNESGQEATVQ